MRKCISRRRHSLLDPQLFDIVNDRFTVLLQNFVIVHPRIGNGRIRSTLEKCELGVILSLVVDEKVPRQSSGFGVFLSRNGSWRERSSGCCLVRHADHSKTGVKQVGKMDGMCEREGPSQNARIWENKNKGVSRNARLWWCRGEEFRGTLNSGNVQVIWSELAAGCLGVFTRRIHSYPEALDR